jgi:hypothetical protein
VRDAPVTMPIGGDGFDAAHDFRLEERRSSSGSPVRGKPKKFTDEWAGSTDRRAVLIRAGWTSCERLAPRR